MEYNPRPIEKKWKKYWEENHTYKVSNESNKPKYYVLDMFPYPSGSGLHVGHPLGYIASDIFARYKRLCGYNVLHPMGYDAFGLPAEQYAIQTGVHPATSTEENIKRYRQQLDNLGFSFDWSRQVKTCEPQYYKWTQWIFLQLFQHYYDKTSNKAQAITSLITHFEKEGNANLNVATSQEEMFTASDWNGMSPKEKDTILMNYRLAYKRVTFVNWCEALGTVLANDEVKDGVSERGGYPVERRPMLQWSLRITAYAERLLSDLDSVEFSDSMKKMQSNWIGRSEGAQLFFDIVGSDKKIEVFTTRPDTIFGATYMVIAPEHDWVAELTTKEQKAEIDAYVAYVNSRSERERMSEVKEVTGAFTGAYAINPFSNEQIPIWIGEYVLKDYGTGAIMAVPSDDDRDNAFADKFGLKIIDVIDKSKYPNSSRSDKEGVMINSGYLNGMEVPEAIEATLQDIEKKGIGKRQINYRLRDAIYSRQRYWGEPFPITYDADGIAHPMDEKDLPLELPDLEDFKPASGGKSPLARREDWVNLSDGFVRETDTMPGFAGSSWYFLRYMDAGNPEEFASQKAINYWQDVDLYVGGNEHAVGHLMYSRFWHKFLYDKGLVPTTEPYKKLINQGMIQGIIEFIYLNKKVEDSNHFICSKLAEQRGDEVAKIPVYIDFISNYGAQNSFLNVEGIKRFIDWRPEFADAKFECGNGIYQNGVFTPTKEGANDSGLITHSEVGKMSKRYFNVVNPDDVVEKYGSDCFRLFEMFLGPLEQSKPWDTQSIGGVSRFLKRMWSLFYNEAGDYLVTQEEPTKDELKILHTTIKKVSENIERFSFNTCVSEFMICVKELNTYRCHKQSILEGLVVMIAPFAPHVAEELWHKMGHTTTVNDAAFPTLNEAHLVEDNINYPISINGKKRALVSFPSDWSKDQLEEKALSLDEIQRFLDGKTVRKVIVVPKRMINIVVS